MTIRSNNTLNVLLEVSAAAYDEIAGKMRAAGYHRAFIDGEIDMHGIGLTKDGECGMCGGTKEVACSSTSYMACPRCCGGPK